LGEWTPLDKGLSYLHYHYGSIPECCTFFRDFLFSFFATICQLSLLPLGRESPDSFLCCAKRQTAVPIGISTRPPPLLIFPSKEKDTSPLRRSGLVFFFFVPSVCFSDFDWPEFFCAGGASFFAPFLIRFFFPPLLGVGGPPLGSSVLPFLWVSRFVIGQLSRNSGPSPLRGFHHTFPHKQAWQFRHSCTLLFPPWIYFALNAASRFLVGSFVEELACGPTLFLSLCFS